MADRALNIAAVTLAVLIPFVVGLAAALLVRGPGPAVGSALVLCSCWAVGMGLLVGFLWRWLR